MKILFLNNQFCIGGAARVAAIQCNELANRGYEIHVVTDNINWKTLYNLNSEIIIHPLNLNPNKTSILQKINKAIQCIRQIKHYIKIVKPDLIIAIQADLFIRTLLARGLNKIPIIAADHSSFNNYNYDRLINFVRHNLYRYADGLSILTNKDLRLLGKKYPQKKVIYNPLSFVPSKGSTNRKKEILCVGRIDAWKIKGFDIILKIWSHVASDFPDWKLVIAGTGSDTSFSVLRQMVNDLEITSQVEFLGLVADMKELYSNIAIFALPSRYEGFPMCLMEAMSQSCACISFEVETSANEMLDAESGIIIKDGDFEEFEMGLRNLMTNETLREQYGSNAMKRCKLFEPKIFGDEWVKLIDNVINKAK